MSDKYEFRPARPGLPGGVWGRWLREGESLSLAQRIGFAVLSLVFFTYGGGGTWWLIKDIVHEPFSASAAEAMLALH